MKRITLLFGLLLVLNACIKNNPDPSWIYIDKWELVENPDLLIGTTGLLTHNISEAWVYVNGETIGVFELPVKLPILQSGNTNIQIFPAIKNNGIAATKKVYPFLERFIVNANLVENEQLNISPVTQYYSSSKFTVIDFEGGVSGPPIEEGPSSVATSSVSSDPLIIDPLINGTKFLKVDLSSSIDEWVASTTINDNIAALDMILPVGKDVYLEIDYYNTNSVTSGIIGIASTGQTVNPNVRLNPQDESEVEWKKIYIELREVVSGLTEAEYFEFSFNAFLDGGKTSSVICIDNIKAVYF